jgi:UDP:flavonoid glycosyltransferase YjiC (YdhE family)
LNYLITPVGSAGDNYPFIGLGVELARRGHRVTVFSNDHFGPLIEQCGLAFVSVGSEEEYRKTIANREIWHPTRGFGVIMGMVGEQIKRLMDALMPRISDDTAVVAHSLDFGSRALAEKTGLRVVTVHLSPLIIRTNYDTGVVRGSFNYSLLPPWMKRMIWRIVDGLLVDPAAAPMVNEIRAKVGLGPMKHVLETAMHSPLLTVGMWPAWYSAPQPDYPPFVKLTGFPMFDGGQAQPVTSDVDEYLTAGEPPIVFTPGSANVHGHEFFEAAMDAAARLGRRTMLLSKFDEHLPAKLPGNVQRFPFAPLSRILSRCAALVHHGGVGTTAAGLAGGVPQVIMPMSHDQPNNAHWVKRLGAGEMIPQKKFTGKRVAKVLGRLLTSPEVKGNCATAAERIARQNAVAETVDLIEGVVGSPAQDDRASVELAVGRS